MEMADARDLHASACEFLLASAIQRELGARNWPRATCDASLAVLDWLPDSGSPASVSADASGIIALDAECAEIISFSASCLFSACTESSLASSSLRRAI